jgi:hypothetical protein
MAKSSGNVSCSSELSKLLELSSFIQAEMALISLSSSLHYPVSDGPVTGLLGREHGISDTDALTATASMKLPFSEAVIPPSASSTLSQMLSIPSCALHSLTLAMLCSAGFCSFSNHDLMTVRAFLQPVQYDSVVCLFPVPEIYIISLLEKTY